MKWNATVALLIRHAHTDAIGQWLAGRAPGVPLNPAGRAQAERLGRALASSRLAAIYASPLERTLETAQAIARHQPAPLHADAALLEIDFGAWTGRTFADLHLDPAWRAYNTRRSTGVIPDGEAAAAVQRRIVGAIEALAARHAGSTFAVVSHGDPIRYAVLHYAGAPLDAYDRFEISPASVSAVALGLDRPRLLYVNNTTLSMPHAHS
jgi:probable phosphoglycerate mutase